MAKAVLKNSKTTASVKDFLKKSTTGQKQKDCLEILALMEKNTGEKAKMWGTALIGLGDVHLKYDSGRELDWFKIGFSPRKKDISLYGLLNDEIKSDLLPKLGKHSCGKGCLYINSLEEIDIKVLEKLIKLAVKRKA